MRNRSRIRTGAVVGVALTLSLGAAACGGSSTPVEVAGPEQTTTTEAGPVRGATIGYLSGAAEATQQSGTASMTMTMAIGDTVVIEADGVTDFDTGESAMTMDMSAFITTMAAESGEEVPPELAQMFAEPMEMRLVDDTMYIRMPFLAALGGGDAQWIAQEVDEDTAAGQGDLGTSGSAYLDFLRSGEGDVTELGTEEIDGVETTHYRAELDVEAILDAATENEDLTRVERRQIRTALEQMANADALVMDLWVDGDDMVRRVQLEMDLEGMLGELAGSGDLPASLSGPLVVTVDYGDFGEPVDIEAPDPEDVIDAEDMMGGLGGLGGTSPSTRPR